MGSEPESDLDSLKKNNWRWWRHSTEAQWLMRDKRDLANDFLREKWLKWSMNNESEECESEREKKKWRIEPTHAETNQTARSRSEKTTSLYMRRETLAFRWLNDVNAPSCFKNFQVVSMGGLSLELVGNVIRD